MRGPICHLMARASALEFLFLAGAGGWKVAPNDLTWPCIMCTHVFGPNFKEEIFRFNFLIQIYLYIFRYLFLKYKGILAFFEHTMLKIIRTRNFMYQIITKHKNRYSVF